MRDGLCELLHQEGYTIDCAQTCREARRLAAENSYHLIVLDIMLPDGTTGQATMRCDAYWISEALKNILKNSCEHTPPNGQIHLFLENTERAITITVEDNGGGVPEKELPWLLQRFYRSSRPAAGEGAGLGLAIARAIVEKHHGIISADNTASGLKITLTFPRLDGILKIGQ